uniref:Uncharacterized protein n=1 Tax=Rhizophora mucronata TaxID=61149 RepID=A0A2P2Q374_RHIMU
MRFVKNISSLLKIRKHQRKKWATINVQAEA